MPWCRALRRRLAVPAGFSTTSVAGSIRNPQSTIRNSLRLAQRAVLPLVRRARPSYAAAAMILRPSVPENDRDFLGQSFEE
jgi:hypothetical protein